MTVFSRAKGRHTRCSQSWGALAHAIATARLHPVVPDTATPALRHPYEVNR